jgi:hypothetical protein
LGRDTGPNKYANGKPFSYPELVARVDPAAYVTVTAKKGRWWLGRLE